MSWQEGMDVANRCLQLTVDTIKLVGPPIALFLLLLADTYSTYIGLNIGFAEGNSFYSHFNTAGITASDVFSRFVLAAVSAVVFLMVEIFARHDTRYPYLWNLALLMFWTSLVGEAFVLYHSLLQSAVAMSLP